MAVSVTIQRPNLRDGDVIDAAQLSSVSVVGVSIDGAVAQDDFTAYKASAATSLSAGLAGLTLSPVGSVVAYAGATPPTTWLSCEGQAVSRTTYAALFKAIGVLWGAGDGTTTFNLPDLRGRTLVALDAGTARTPVATAIAINGGASTVTLTAAQIPAHSHTTTAVAATVSTAGSHTHTETVPYVPNQSIAGTYDMVMHHVQNDPFNKPSTNGAGWLTGSDTYNWPNELDVSVYGARPMVAAGAHVHDVTIPAMTSSTVGGGTSHENMPPFAAVRWIIRAI